MLYVDQRRYLLRPTAIEVALRGHHRFFLAFFSAEEAQLVAEKLSALGYTLSVENMDGTLVGKVLQPGMDARKLAGEVGKGVDLVALCLISANVGFATGSAGGSVGGLAGAGVI